MTQIIAPVNRQQQLSPLEAFKRELNSMSQRFKSALPSNIAPEKFMSVVTTAMTMNPELLMLDRQSLYQACLKCANDGLLPDGREAALVKFKDKVQYMPMLGGLIKRIRNSGEIATLNAEVVYQGDAFEYWIDEDGKHLKHTPDYNIRRGNADNALLAYAVVKFKDGDVDYEIMNREEIEKVRAKSRMASGGVWGEWWGEMAKKTIIRRFSKRLPMSTDVKNLIENEDEHFEKIEAPRTKAAELTALLSPEEPKQLEVSPEFLAAVDETPDPRVVK